MRRLFTVFASLLLAANALADTNNTQVQCVPKYTQAPAIDGDMCPTSVCAYTCAWTTQYLMYHAVSTGVKQTYGPINMNQFRGVRECRVEFKAAVPSLCTLPNITIEQTSDLNGAWNTITTFTGGTPPAIQSYDHRAPVGPFVRASLASDITDTDCDANGGLDLVVVCGY